MKLEFGNWTHKIDILCKICAIFISSFHWVSIKKYDDVKIVKKWGIYG